MTLVLCVVLVALIFEYINGFHDTANAIATSVSTKVLTPAQAIILSTVCNLAGALIGVAVAKTVGQGLVDTKIMTLTALLCALAGAIIWNLVTWWVGLPSSSSHALFGGLCGAALGAAHGNWSAIIWFKHTAIDPVTHQAVEVGFLRSQGLWPKVIFPMMAAPVCGFFIGFLIMGLLYALLRDWRPRYVNLLFGKVQILSAAWMSIGHGMNDAQKTMGIIALTLFTATTKGDSFAHLPDWLGFLYLPKFEIPFWVKLSCALTMACGTAAGGWRIIKTLGSQMVKLQPVHGFSAQTTAAVVIESASHWGIPLSTTHVISSSIMGVGASKRFSAVKWSVVERMAWAWTMTLPITGAIGYALMRLVQLAGLAE
jgi:inorganic phosphate transporter, PiT family